MEADFVLVRAFGDVPVVQCLVEIDGATALVSAPSEFAKLKAGGDALPPVGVPVEDLYQWRTEIADEIHNGTFSWAAQRALRRPVPSRI